MLLNGGQLDGARILSRTTVALMTSDQLGKIKEAGITPGELLLGTRGYTFGLGFAVRLDDGVAGTPGRASSCGRARRGHTSGSTRRSSSSRSS